MGDQGTAADSGSTGESGQQSQDSGNAAEMPAWAKQLQADINKRFEGMSSKNTERFAALEGRLPKEERAGNGSQAPAGNGAPSVPGLTADDVRAIVQFGTLRASVPEAAREGLDRIQQEHGFAAAVNAAELIAATSPAKGDGTKGASPPKGHGASPAPSTSPGMPRTVQELLDIKAKDEARYKAIVSHPDFDLDELRRQR